MTGQRQPETHSTLKHGTSCQVMEQPSWFPPGRLFPIKSLVSRCVFLPSVKARAPTSAPGRRSCFLQHNYQILTELNGPTPLLSEPGRVGNAFWLPIDRMITWQSYAEQDTPSPRPLTGTSPRPVRTRAAYQEANCGPTRNFMCCPLPSHSSPGRNRSLEPQK